ncbi:hypothetical protein HII31_06534 [Pseudocercospora fuligena]|uniref:Uncharacterized protein n=1 Tax=Pseudocercospora fuligena TaxID=685502 RepID=A0A8H6VH38_9PEZI|nr:hypothetical protein HII31_06534 [Pseudocercospora fuligena]
MVAEIIEEAVKLIPKLCTYFLRANFPSKNSLTDEVVPTPWKPHVHEIKHLELTTRLMDYSSTRYYPVELFKAQDHIANLKEWFPELQSVTFTIIEGTDKQRDYLKRGTSQQTTTLAAEIEKIVEEMQKLDVPKKGIRLCVRNGLHWTNPTFDYHDAETKGAWDDVSGTHTDDLSCQEITTVAIHERLKLVRIVDHKQEAREEESSGETPS